MTFARDPRAGATAIKIEEVGWSERETHRRERKALLFLSLPAPRVTGAHPSPSPPGHTHSCRQPARSEEAVGGAEAWAPPQPSHPCAASACQRSCTGGRGGGQRGPLPPRSPGSGIHFPVSRAPAAAPAPPDHRRFSQPSHRTAPPARPRSRKRREQPQEVTPSRRVPRANRHCQSEG